ncbi:MAG: hypothetical protein WAT36_04670 [Chromatiaceae bacterium]
MSESVPQTQVPRRRRGPRGALVRLVLMVGAIGIFILGYQWGNQRHFGQPPAIEGVILAPAMPLPAFALVDTEGQPFGRDQLADHWTLLALGDLTQPRGQLAIQRLLDVYHRLGTEVEPRQRPWLVLAAPSQSADLARDFGRLSPALRLVSGEAGDLGQLAKLLGEPPHPERDSRATLYLIAPNTRLLAFFPPSQAAQAVAADLTLLAAWPLDALENLSHE